MRSGPAKLESEFNNRLISYEGVWIDDKLHGSAIIKINMKTHTSEWHKGILLTPIKDIIGD